jgi:hypothetical protein
MDAFIILSQNVSANHCHHQGVVFTSQCTQTVSVVWMYVDYSLSGAASCRGIQPRVYSGFSSAGIVKERLIYSSGFVFAKFSI